MLKEDKIQALQQELFVAYDYLEYCNNQIEIARYNDAQQDYAMYKEELTKQLERIDALKSTLKQLEDEGLKN